MKCSLKLPYRKNQLEYSLGVFLRHAMVNTNSKNRQYTQI